MSKVISTCAQVLLVYCITSYIVEKNTHTYETFLYHFHYSNSNTYHVDLIITQSIIIYINKYIHIMYYVIVSF